jgi:hypothetical protein
MPDRPRIGDIRAPGPLEDLPQLPPFLQSLRDDLQRRVKARHVKGHIKRELSHINGSREIASSVRLLFDGQGRPTGNLSLKDIIKYRQKVETDIRWLTAILSELNDDLLAVRDLEDAAMDVASVQQAEENN